LLNWRANAWSASLANVSLVPAARAVAIWFTPRIELLPVSGHVFPLAQMREDDPVDQQVTSLFLC